jgi:drug/metabolite transporter, DME family
VTSTQPSLNRGALFIVAAALLWGTTGTAAAFAPTVGPMAIGAAAMGVGGLLQACVAARQIAAHRRSLARDWRVLALSAAAAAVYPLAFYSSMRMAGVAVGTVVSIGSAPLFAAAADFSSTRHVPSRSWLVGLAMGLTGIVLLAVVPHHAAASTTSGGSAHLGIALGLAAGATYALYTWGATHVMANGCPSRATTGAIFGFAGILLAPVVMTLGGPILATLRSIEVVAYLAVVPMFVGYLLFTKGLASTTASKATLLTLIEPAAAALIAAAILGERLPVPGWVGVCLLLASVACMTRTSAVRTSVAIAPSAAALRPWMSTAPSCDASSRLWNINDDTEMAPTATNSRPAQQAAEADTGDA